MSLWDRIARLFEDASPVWVDERVRVGSEGEFCATRVIRDAQPQCFLSNVIVPVNGPGPCWKETDHVVLWGGTVFIVEVKNYKGVLRWADDQRSALVQLKTGNYGEAIAPKPARNPLVQAHGFLRLAKQYLSRQVDPRFQRLRFQPVGVFTRAAHLDFVHSWESGLIYVDELPAYFARHRNPRFAQNPSPWLQQGLERLPRLDYVLDTAEQVHLGILEGSALEYQEAGGDRLSCHWDEIVYVHIEPATGLFSEQDNLLIRWRNGQRCRTPFRHGTIRLRTLGGQRKELKLRSLQHIVPSPVRLLAFEGAKGGKTLP